MNIIIVGAGLSGLLTAYRLKKMGFSVTVLEARDRIGGRIHTVTGANGTPVEMGATWFGPQHQQLILLLNELGLPFFEQYLEGTAFFQPFSISPAESFILPQEQASYRIAGGTSALVECLYQAMDEDEVLLNQTVTEIKSLHQGIEVSANEKFLADRVIITLPPKLWANTLNFEPGLPQDLAAIAKNTQTWMEGSIKMAFIYEKPFWREKNYSGVLFSNVGPVTEFYDHCNADNSSYALCGFVSSSYKDLPEKDRREAIKKQLLGIYGAEAETYIDCQEYLWGNDPYTSQPSENPIFPHQNHGHERFENELSDDRIFFCGTETSAHFGGYMEGAVLSSNRVVRKIFSH